MELINYAYRISLHYLLKIYISKLLPKNNKELSQSSTHLMRPYQLILTSMLTIRMLCMHKTMLANAARNTWNQSKKYQKNAGDFAVGYKGEILIKLLFSIVKS